MALRAGYYGIKRKLIKKIMDLPAIKTIGAGLALQNGNLVVTGDLDDYAPNIIANTQLLKDTVGWSARQKIPYPYNGNSNHIDVTLTVENGKIKINGTQGATKGEYFLSNRQVYDYQLPAGDYKFTGAVSYISFEINKNNVTGDASQGTTSLGSDDGNGLSFTLTEFSDIQVKMNISKNHTFDNVIVYPLLTDANILDRSRGEYRGTTAFPRDEQAILSAKNIWDDSNDSHWLDSGSATHSISDGVITVNMTATDASGIWMSPSQWLNGHYAKYAGLKGKLSFDFKGDGSFDAELGFRLTSDSTPEINHVTTDWQHYECYDIPDLNNWQGSFMLYNKSGAVHTLQVKNIMLRLATDPVDVYVPYAMTNRELTDSAAEQKTAINAIITAATGAADFAEFKTAIGAITPVTRSIQATPETREEITEPEEEPAVKKITTRKKSTAKADTEKED